MEVIHDSRNTKMNEDQIKSKLTEALSRLYENQVNLFAFTSQTHQTEWNLVNHLANEVRNIFPEFDCDVDVIKPNLGNKRPDIILHKRGTHSSNFLVIEVKRSESELAGDLDKTRQSWFGSELNYQFGAVIAIMDNSFIIKVIKNLP